MIDPLDHVHRNTSGETSWAYCGRTFPRSAQLSGSFALEDAQCLRCLQLLEEARLRSMLWDAECAREAQRRRRQILKARALPRRRRRARKADA